jgi:hypothetical protein
LFKSVFRSNNVKLTVLFIYLRNLDLSFKVRRKAWRQEHLGLKFNKYYNGKYG